MSYAVTMDNHHISLFIFDARSEDTPRHRLFGEGGSRGEAGQFPTSPQAPEGLLGARACGYVENWPVIIGGAGGSSKVLAAWPPRSEYPCEYPNKQAPCEEGRRPLWGRKLDAELSPRTCPHAHRAGLLPKPPRPCGHGGKSVPGAKGGRALTALAAGHAPAKRRRAARPRRRVRRRRVDRDGQTLLQFPLTWGGKRPGAGRKPAGKVAGEAHRRRPAPPRPAKGAVHAVIKVRKGLPSLRQARCMKVIWHVLVAAKTAYKMRVVHFCVQNNHIHLIIEAPDRRAFLSGMRGLSIRLSRRLNAALGLSGRLLADRYHVEMLDNFLRLRRAIAYVLNNTRRHAFQHGGWTKPARYIDPCSSAFYFDGWRGLKVKPPPLSHVGQAPVEMPGGFALRLGWRRHGLIAIDEIPGASSG